jgi:starch-binding outer membrane protein, SusD/RagB family
MKKTTYIIFFVALTIISVSCKKQLDVGNPNSPRLESSVNSESGLAAFAQGGVYFNGFRDGLGWLGDSYFSLPWGYHDLMGDVLTGGEGSNNQTTTMGVPDAIVLDNGTRITNPSPQVQIIRVYNNRSATANANNALYYEWLSMYAMNSAMNTALAQVDKISFLGDAETKKSTIRAWCYYWKGFAYGAIGTMYYAGIIADSTGVFDGKYVTKDAILAESNANYQKAAGYLAKVTSVGDYSQVLGKLIPAQNRVGLGGILTTAEWGRSINTMLARNILLNKIAPFVNGVKGTIGSTAPIAKASTGAMTSADWDQVLTYANNGIKQGDHVFTGRTTTNNSFFTAPGGSSAAISAGKNTVTTYKVSERVVQDFNTGDARKANNFNTNTTFINNYSFTTRYSLIDGGLGTPGVFSYGTRTVGAYELLFAGSFEENALMLAEANIWKGSVNTALSQIDAVRVLQGAGLPALAGTGLNANQALTELTKERRVALMFRGLSFFDMRRWGWIYGEANGGGRFGSTVVSGNGAVVNTNAKIFYNYMDYWDVPADEVDLNPAAAGSAATKNPNY